MFGSLDIANNQSFPSENWDILTEYQSPNFFMDKDIVLRYSD
jgi:hypothetical protein